MTVSTDKIPNRLINETSPYLLQHAYNPVDWFPWCDEAFAKAKAEDKPVFLSIGYSTCHWCHVMENESFEDEEVAEILNDGFVCIKVDKEERPDVDSIYMNVCQALTGSGGWPLTVVMDYAQKPFFAGTYFPKYARYQVVGFMDLLNAIRHKWITARDEIIISADSILRHIKADSAPRRGRDENLIETAVQILTKTFDGEYGGFGKAPKFPTPHNLLFLLEQYNQSGDKTMLNIAEKTLISMYRGGIFDHIGFGFSRYSTDREWLAPHFEKMLYDNALLIMAYVRAFELTNNWLYKEIAEKTIDYILREMTHEDGGFLSAQDADSDGVEGKYYVFSPDEIIEVLGKENGTRFNRYYDITESGNFEGSSIPNIINNVNADNSLEFVLPAVFEYRRNRNKLHKDDKILASWNGLMIAALSQAYSAFGDEKYLSAAQKAIEFIERNLYDGTALFTSFREGKKSVNGFIDDYAFVIYAYLKLYSAALDKNYLDKAIVLTNKTVNEFYDAQNGGFFLYGNSSEQLITRPKEIYDGAIPSGNSVMVWNLFALSQLTAQYTDILSKHVDFMKVQAQYPSGNGFFLMSLLAINNPPSKITVVLKNRGELETIKSKLPKNAMSLVLENENDEYKLLNGQTTYYICEKGTCYPPRNEL